MGHFGMQVEAGQESTYLRRSEQVKLYILAGPSPISPMKAEITISPISNNFGRLSYGWTLFHPRACIDVSLELAFSVNLTSRPTSPLQQILYIFAWAYVASVVDPPPLHCY